MRIDGAQRIFREETLFYDTAMVDTCHYISFQTHRMYNTKSEQNVNHGLWVVMTCPCRFIIVTNVPALEQDEVRELMPVWGQGLMGTLYFPLNFAVNLKLLRKKKNQSLFIFSFFIL